MVMNRRLLKKMILYSLYRSGFRGEPARSLTVVTYHKVRERADPEDPLEVSAATFEKQILYLKKNYRVLSGAELADLLLRRRPLPGRMLLITFDDGWRDNYLQAFPLLKKHGLPALLFVSTDFIGSGKVFWFEAVRNLLEKARAGAEAPSGPWLGQRPELAAPIGEILRKPGPDRPPAIRDLIIKLKGLPGEEMERLLRELASPPGPGPERNGPAILSWDEVREMSAGGFTIGSHTRSHPILTQIHPDRIAEELKGSKERIEKEIGKEVQFLSYPNGNFDAAICRMAARAGYLASFAGVGGINPTLDRPHEIQRKHLRETTSRGWGGKFSEDFLRVALSDVERRLPFLQHKGPY